MTTLTFSGIKWDVRAQVSATQEAPGSNWWSDTAAFATISSNALALNVRQDAAQSNRWSSVELESVTSFGYGTYEWVFGASNAGTIHQNLAMSLYTYSDSVDFGHREIGIHFSRWGNAAATTNARYSMGRSGSAPLQENFVQASGNTTRHRFTWAPGRVIWESYTSAGVRTNRFVYTGRDVPAPGGEKVGIRFWMPLGTAFTPGATSPFSITSFTHTPLGEESGVYSIRNSGATGFERESVVVGSSSFTAVNRTRSSIGAVPMIYAHDAMTDVSTMPKFRQAPYFDELRSVAGAGIPVIAPVLASNKNYGNPASITAITTNLNYHVNGSLSSYGMQTRNDQVFLWGDGMGALPVLNWAWRNIGKVAGIVLRNPIVNLTDYFSRNASLQSEMNTAYGGSSQFTAALPSHDPSLNTALLALLGPKIKIWYGGEDTQVPPEIVVAFANAIQAETQVIPGAGHADYAGTTDYETTGWLLSANRRVERAMQSYTIDWQDSLQWSKLTMALITAPESGIPDNYTLTVGSNRGRVVNPGGGTQGTNDRRWYYNPDFVAVNSEIHNRMHSSNGILGGQQGNGHRIVQRPDGTGTAFVAWQNIFFANPWLINFGVWLWDGLNSGLSTQQSANGYSSECRAHTGGDVTSAVRSGNVVTYTCTTYRTTPVIGDAVSVVMPGATSFNFNGTITNVSGMTFSAAQTGANASTSTDGEFFNHTRGLFLPLHLRTRLLNKTIEWKTWYEGVSEPAWGDPLWGGTHVYPGSDPVVPGRSGFLIGHVQGPPRFVEQGVFETWEL